MWELPCLWGSIAPECCRTITENNSNFAEAWSWLQKPPCRASIWWSLSNGREKRRCANTYEIRGSISFLCALQFALFRFSIAACFFSLLQKLYVFVSGPYVHQRNFRELQRFIETRWTCSIQYSERQTASHHLSTKSNMKGITCSPLPQ